MNLCWAFRYDGITGFRYYGLFEIFLDGENGHNGQDGVNGLGDTKI